MKPKPSRIFETLLGLALSAFVLWSYYLSNFVFKDPASSNGPGVFSWLESLEFKLYDARSKFRTSIDAGSKDIVIVTIDDYSIIRLGRWPWPRTQIAQMTDLLASAKPKVLGIDIVLSEPEDVEGSEEIKALETKYKGLVKSRQILQRGANFSSEFNTALTRLNFDEVLKESFAKAGNVILPILFTGGSLKGSGPEPMPPAVAKSALGLDSAAADTGLGRANMEGMKPVVPLPIFAQAVLGLGHVNTFSDFDGTVRREYPVLKYNDAYYPSFALQAVIRYLNFEPKNVVVTPGHSIHIGKNVIPLDENESMMISFNGPAQTFHNYSFYDVLKGKVLMDVFKDKIVLLGHSAAAISTLYITPVAPSLPGTELMANIIENMLHLRFLTRPDWAMRAELGSIGFAAFFVTFVLPFLTAFWSLFFTIFLLAGLGGAGFYYFIHGFWLKIAYSGFLLAAGYVVITTKRLFIVEEWSRRVEASSMETNRMLGLSLQGQGMLDLAFEKFRLCLVDAQMKELLYNLGLDFERKRQYNKAAAVYEYILAKDPKYKDIAEKIKVLKRVADGAAFGGAAGRSKGGELLFAPGGPKPMLGRYEVEKEIGRGSMGIVYLGNDPKIKRKVAIKTMVLEEGTEPAVVKETKERFFREAESAGTLNHPSIVRIFDAGEEYDVTYIAMEFLDGHDLSRYAEKDKLLPPEVVMEYIVKVADALDFAHTQGIIHRDVKPANIMLLKDKSIRVTDFGIARITASTKTATGTVIGTPAYMSPEQVSGKKVDGRSDIFSLGVVLFELLLGQRPFKAGDGGLGTLLFQIANDPEPDPLQINPKLPVCVVQIVHRALKKDPSKRYQKAADMASALRACLKIVKEEKAPVMPEPAPPLEVFDAAVQPIPVTLERTQIVAPVLPRIEPPGPPEDSPETPEVSGLTLSSAEKGPPPTGSVKPPKPPDTAEMRLADIPPPPSAGNAPGTAGPNDYVAGPQPAAAISGHGHPPAHAVPGVRGILGAVRLRHGLADHALSRAMRGSTPRAAGPWSPGCSKAPASCWARPGRTTCSDGAATGAGTRWKTLRCCPGSAARRFCTR